MTFMIDLGQRLCGQWLSIFRRFGSCCFRSWKRWVHLATGTTLYNRMACSATPDSLVSLPASALYTSSIHFWIRNWSHITSRLVFLLLLLGTTLKG